MTSDPAKAGLLRVRLRDLLPPGIDPLGEEPGRRLRAERSFNALAAKVFCAMENGLAPSVDLSVWESEARVLVTHAKREIRFALLEEGGDVPLQELWKQTARLEDRVERILLAERQRRMPAPFWTRFAALRPAFGTAEQATLSVNRLCRGRKLSTGVPVFVPDAFFVGASPERPWPFSLGSAVLGYCPAPMVARDIWKDVLEACGGEDQNPRLAFNSANLDYLVNDRVRARERWARSVPRLTTLCSRGASNAVAVACVSRQHWDPAKLEFVVRKVRESAPVIVECMSTGEIVPAAGVGRVCEANLFSPAGETETIRLAPGLAAPYERLWIYSTGPERWDLPGIGPLAVPSLLVSWGFPVDQSWAVGEALAQGSVIVLLRFGERGSGGARAAERLFEERLHCSLELSPRLRRR